MNKDEMKKKYGPYYIANVIRIIDNRTLIVNAGRGILKIGDIVQVYEIGEEILDLDATPLERYTFCKDELEVIRTEKTFSVCQKPLMEKTSSSTAAALSPLLETKRKVAVPLNINRDDIQRLTPEQVCIQIGDPIKLA